ncbi:ATP-dependent RNA helicase DDX1 [Triplophysa rosa]|uniref:ATP-dependent RNA helicase n=1 Tax=Triplophysa rosa TaxID=992332 RepID=A0A9W7TNS3_TRIRA|nr:ATP-dependent RNA helicase DDX1 [Triplophysa rosa]KAI7799718.1 ATP-dependent RNA helicase DDX1 [Triplophysa rosa]
MAAYSELGVMAEIAQAVEEMDWLLPTDIQAESIPLILGGGDVLMAAETGSGKTGAFSIPLIQIVYETLKDLQEGKKGRGAVKTGGAVFNKWQMNPYDRSPAFAIGPDGMCCQSREFKEWHGCRSTKAVTKGKYYYEVSCHDQGLCRVGWSTSQASLDLGTDKDGFGFGGTGKKSHNKQFDSYGEEFTMHDVIGCYIDMDKGHLSFSKNGNDLGLAFEIPPQLKTQPFFASCVLKNAELKFNFGDEPFKNQPKDGFIALSQASDGHVVKSAQTGSAKVSEVKSSSNAPRALIIEPSKELAEQTLNNVNQFKKYVENPKLRDLLIMGGVAAKEQLSILESGVDIVVGTPGRLDDLISTKKLDLSQVRFLVLDECDGLLTAGYTDFIMRVYNQIPQVTSDGKRLQVIVCSATLHSFEVKKLSEKIMHFPTWVDLKGEDSVPETVHHVVVPVYPKNDKLWEKPGKNHIRTDEVHAKDDTRPGANSPEMWSEAIKILKGEYTLKAIKEHKMDQAIIFCRTKIDCDNLEEYFIKHGGGPDKKGHQFSCVCLHGDRKPNERKYNLEIFKKQDVKFLICTDVAARGIDIRGVPYVINVTLPDEKQNYVHRIGRVGRADRMGLAISLVAMEKEKVWYHSCPSRGKSCNNTRLKENGGCTIWYNEKELLSEIEEHLKCTITQCEPDIKVPVDEFDGKVTYGQRRATGGGLYKGHVDILAPTVRELANLEREAQTSFLHLCYLPNQLFKAF